LILSQLAARIPQGRLNPGNPDDPDISRVEYDSRRVRPGTLFAAIPGAHADGHRFLGEAFSRGAAAAAVTHIPPGFEGHPLVIVPDARRALALFAGELAGHPDRDLDLVGVTGTNGKTTTAYLLEAVLNQAGRPAGLISTVETRLRDQRQPAERTTPEAPEIYRLLSHMRAAGCRAVVMEVSSHALELQRVWGLRFAAAVFTNLTQDHLDFHGDMETYFQAKARLFQEYTRGEAVINLDDPYGRRLADLAPGRVVTYGLQSGADVTASDVILSPEGLRLTVRLPVGDLDLVSPLVGRFNAYNLLCGLAASFSLGIPPEVFAAAARDFRGAPGRMERFDLGGRWAYVDYAHTPDALEKALAELKRVTPGPVHALFGAGGNRDRAKRPLMGRAAERIADRIYITTDNPRDEEPEAIARDVLGGLDRPQSAVTILDRREAIRTALEELPAGGVLLIAGKGHEDYQEIRWVKHPFDDREEVRKYLEHDTSL